MKRFKSLILNGLPAIVITIVFVGLAIFSWGRWLDPVIDFGRELYIPWQISEGRVPQVNFISSYGPLSHLFNAGWFRLFGASVLTLVVVNHVVLMVATWLVYAITARVGSRMAATVCTILFLTTFGFGHLMFTGNFNFITPYSHEMTHGFTVGLFGLYCFLRYTRSESLIWPAGMGVAIGLSFITKPEIFVAVAGALGVGITLILWTRRGQGKNLKVIEVLGLATASPVIYMLLSLAARLPWMTALRETGGAWAMMGNAGMLSLPFYANSTGMDNPAEHIKWMGTIGFFLGWLLFPGLACAIALNDGNGWRRVVGAILGAAVTGLALNSAGNRLWLFCGAILGVGMLLVFGGQLGMLMKRWPIEGERNGRIGRMAVIVFAMLMLLKMFLHTRFEQYGFVLGVMATMVLVVAVVEWVPGMLEGMGRRGWAFRAAGLVVVCGLMVASVKAAGVRMGYKTAAVGRGADQFMADGRAPVMQDMVDYIARNTRPEATVMVAPEGAMLNYLARRHSSVPYVLFTPPEFAIFGEGRMVWAIMEGKPEYVVIVHRMTDDLGPARFGKDYAQEVAAWLGRNYVQVHVAGKMPFEGEEFGMVLWRRRDVN